ncbi:hypothetical protein CRUP_016465 [Coryphaenoides rupestris]|nr:hypothetical protein CRUP_016465 [Coryphaenoides rupestris]
MTSRQTAVETLRKTCDSLMSCEGELLSHPEEIQETVVSDRNEKLQITLTRSMSVQDGLDDMMDWMQGVEASVTQTGQTPLDSAALGALLSKEAALGQDIASRQSSISAIKAKVEKFAETADPSAATSLQSKMESLSQRLADTCESHQLKVSGLERVKGKVERFEQTAEKVQQFVEKRSGELRETDGPGKSFKELSQLMQVCDRSPDSDADDDDDDLILVLLDASFITWEMVSGTVALPSIKQTILRQRWAEHNEDLELLKSLAKELSAVNPEASKTLIQGRLDGLTNVEEEVSSCQDQLAGFRSAAGEITAWLEETDRKGSGPSDQRFAAASGRGPAHPQCESCSQR